jgi:UDP-N-acetylmuramoyl-tripeptide--D-alanyl-D-alanine ligase
VSAAAVEAAAYATLPAVTGAHPTPSLTADDIVGITGGELVRRSARPVRGAAADSRRVRSGNLFVALPGERTDGHRFLAAAAQAGAAALLVTDAQAVADLPAEADLTVVRVADGLAALAALAADWRTRFEPLVVGVTGSIAKTSVKEATATVLATRWRTLRNPGNENNEIGLPRTLLDLDASHQAVVLEMGMYVGGEIAGLARIARPHIGVVTAVSGVHLARIGSIDAIERAKAELVEALPADGTAVLNADDPRVARMAGRTHARVVTYGFADGAAVTAEAVESAGPAGMRFVLRLPGGEGADTTDGDTVRRAVACPALGRLSVHNALAAAAVGWAAGLTADEISAGLAGGWSAPHRAERLVAGGVTVIDDSYNASPASMVAALDLLAGLPGRRVAVLGEMLELGEAAAAGHIEVGRAAAGIVDLLVVVGADGSSPATAIADAAAEAGLASSRIVRAADRTAASAACLERLRPGDTVLVKASRGVELERLVGDLVRGLAAPGGRPA